MIMRIILSQLIIPQDDDRGTFQIEKEVAWPFVPRVGDELGDSLYKEPNEMKVVRVEFSTRDDTCYIFIEPLKVPTLVESELPWKRLAELHKWKV